MPRVSVVIPTHDRRDLVLEAVASVRAQSFADHEIIVVDDGSRDGTVASLEAEHGRAVRLLEQSQAGVSAARNAGVAAARGEWIAFLDSDDLWLPTKLAAQVRWLEEHAEIAICQTEEIWLRRGRRVNACRHHAKPEGDIFRASLERCLVSPSAVVLRRALLDEAGGFDESLAVCEDYDLWLRLARTHRFGLLREALVIKRGGHDDQLSRRFWGMDRFRIASLSKLLAGSLTPDQRRAAIEVLHRKCEILAAGAAKRGRGDEAESYRAWAAAHV